jgi:hypothetical protein
MKVDAWLWSGSSLGLVVMTMKTGMINEQHATGTRSYERYRDDEMFLTGAFGGVKIFIHPIKGADPDDRCWRMYFAPRVQGVEKDRAYPTKATRAGLPAGRASESGSR